MQFEHHPDQAVELFRRMCRIRIVEEAIAARYSEGNMRCPTHLSIGQEAVASAAGMALLPSDQAVSTHRSHAHYLGKGGNLNAMIAELYGKKSGCSGGRGGSMHLTDLAVGYLASTAIVGNSIPLGVGAALTDKYLKNGNVSCVFLGDAAVEEGAFHEAANFAVLKQLPVLFICENNLYSVYTHLRDRQPANRQIWQWANAYGMKSALGDGNDAWAVYVQILDSVRRIRNGDGPEFLEFSTYRWREHCGPFYDNDLGYRTLEEFEEWKMRDPISRLQAALLSAGILTQNDVQRINEESEAEVAEAFRFAEESAFPAKEEAYTLLFAD
jgi:pyruvate dehydrogenase E1 component alpha subunit